MLLKGENLGFLQALREAFEGAVRCVYLDPPYNTGENRRGYNDSFGGGWLSFMECRLRACKELMTVDGTVWISIDDSELFNLKPLMDSVFGKNNFIQTVVWKRRKSIINRARYIARTHEYILVYARDKKSIKDRWGLPRPKEMDQRYKNPDNDPKGDWAPSPITLRGNAQNYPITGPTGRVFYPPKGRGWKWTQETYARRLAEGRVYFGKNGDSFPSIKTHLADARPFRVCSSVWGCDEVGSTEGTTKELQKCLNRTDVFSTSKPEPLIERILTLCTKEGDLVLDPFAGSGTTGVVAARMGRKWIMIEESDSVEKYIIPRLEKEGISYGGDG